MAQWVIDGKKDGCVPEPGKIYKVKHKRKGTFVVRCEAVHDDWLTGEIVEGETQALVAGNARCTGEEITIRDVLSSLTELPAGAVSKALADSGP